ncbi:MAG: hypothetical protein JSR77_00820 [Planctomycetes bacterium]|nr:hypothetical protein [Planctomycetota bacterium]
MRSATLGVVLSWLALLPAAAEPVRIPNGDFAQGALGDPPSSWFTPPAAKAKIELAASGPNNSRCVIMSRGPQDKAFGNIITSIDAKPLRGQRFRLSAMVSNADLGSRVQMWVRADGPDGQMGFFDNMGDRPITSGQWRRYETIGEIVDPDERLVFGFMLFGTGPASIADVQLETLGAVVNADRPPRPLDAHALANLTAFARLSGYVRHFHPTDAAKDLDWQSFTIAGVERVERSQTPQSLRDTLTQLFAPIAPSVVIGGEELPAELPLPPDATRWRSWRHQGYGQDDKGNGRNIYSSKTYTEALDKSPDERKGSKPGACIRADLGGGVFARIPIGVYLREDRKEIPETSGAPAAPDRPEGWKPSGRDRSTRLAAIIIAWNALEHFYPYFDVVKTDWQAALSDGLRSAATDADAAAFTTTLGHLGAALHDGHTWITGGTRKSYSLPLELTWVGDELAVVRSKDAQAAAGIEPGDVILEIDGESTKDAYITCTQTLSAATDQWLRYRARTDIGSSVTPAIRTLTVRHANGSTASIRVTLTQSPAKSDAHRPDNGALLAPGVVYFNLDGTDAAELNKHLPELTQAKAVVFDLRGYPGEAGSEVLRHLTDKNIVSAHWNVPVITMPDGADRTFISSNWNMPPLEPRINGKIIFLTDGTAISYAESCMGIVEGMKLGEIVGSPTAGTNGNINFIQLPGKFSISFTGMQVIKHDGTPHHGRGIAPTIPAYPTIAGLAAGKDEVLEKAIEVASQ